MREFEYKQFTQRHRPHIQPPGATLFLTYRLAGSVPQATVREHQDRKVWLASELTRVRALSNSDDSVEISKWLERVEKFQRQWFAKFEAILHQAAVGPTWMKDDRVAAVVADGLRELDGKDYRLDCFCVMSNHVHTVFKPFVTESNLREVFGEDKRLRFFSDYPGLPEIMKRLKGRSARKANVILDRCGSFWEHENFDHVIRTGRFQKTVAYVLNNPVKAGLVKHWREWPWSYCRKQILDSL